MAAAAQLVRTEEDVEEEEDTTFPSTTSWTTVTTRLVVVLEDLVVTLQTNQNSAQVSVCIAHWLQLHSSKRESHLLVASPSSSLLYSAISISSRVLMSSSMRYSCPCRSRSDLSCVSCSSSDITCRTTESQVRPKSSVLRYNPQAQDEQRLTCIWYLESCME